MNWSERHDDRTCSFCCQCIPQNAALYSDVDFRTASAAFRCSVKAAFDMTEVNKAQKEDFAKFGTFPDSRPSGYA